MCIGNQLIAAYHVTFISRFVFPHLVSANESLDIQVNFVLYRNVRIYCVNMQTCRNNLFIILTFFGQADLCKNKIAQSYRQFPDTKYGLNRYLVDLSRLTESVIKCTLQPLSRCHIKCFTSLNKQRLNDRFEGSYQNVKGGHLSIHSYPYDFLTLATLIIAHICFTESVRLYLHFLFILW